MNSNVPRPRLRVEIAPAAWASLGQLPSAAFRKLRQQLDLLTAESLAELTSGRSTSAEPCPLTVTVDGLTANCTFDPAQNLVTLFRVERTFSPGED